MCIHRIEKSVCPSRFPGFVFLHGMRCQADRIVMGLKTENVFFLGLTFSIKEDKLDSQLFNLS